MNMHSCACSVTKTTENAQKSERLEKIALLADASDLCSDCGHKRSCCAEKQDQEFSLVVGEITFNDLQLVESSSAGPVTTPRLKREMLWHYLNKAPPQDLVSLHQKLLV